MSWHGDFLEANGHLIVGETLMTNNLLLGLIGVLLGLLVGEYFRRKKRIEDYSKEVFQERLLIYEELFTRVNQLCDVVRSIGLGAIDQDGHLPAVHSAAGEVLLFCKKHEFYLRREIVAQLIWASRILTAESPERRGMAYYRFWIAIRRLKDMIRKEAGVSELDNLFKAITKARHKSRELDEFREWWGGLP